MNRLVFVSLLALVPAFSATRSTPSAASEYSIQAIRYAMLPGFPVAGLVMGAPKGEKLDIAMVIWLIRGGGRNTLFDSGFYRESWVESLPMTAFVRPGEA